ncbi:DoxX family protein [Campylobacter iguaniorum]|uniref:DoxX family protein n=1 Tax=Campylobacter iguaniorum TaxID=1244531 RepID=A0A076FCZ2_9BACT|nr:DoxX family protein [Campylobacter iguaniorum]AII15508.1 DoxX family protein [Campylobacter iguaniorum]ALV25422.1 DoxX family protein [Campylobacter iguaniorum]
MRSFCSLLSLVSSNFQSITLLLIRLILAFGFYETAILKWQNIEPTAEWFASIGVPFPLLSVYLVAIFEALAVVLFVLGLFTRAICVPLIVIILVAIFSVHFQNGYSLANNGFEVPLYYLAMILTLFSFGGGKISLDKAVFKDDK